MSDFDQPQQVDDFNAPAPGEKQSNPLGIAGFVLSLTCLLSPIGLILSLIALTKKPKGFAIAGTIIGLVLTIVLAIGVATAIAAINSPVNQWTTEVAEDYTQISTAIDQSGSTPDSLNALSLNTDVTTDPWGNPYQYTTTDAGGWTLTTAGPDQSFDTADDLTLEGELGAIALGMNLGEIGQVWTAAAERMQDGETQPEAPAENNADTDTDNNN